MFRSKTVSRREFCKLGSLGLSLVALGGSLGVSAVPLQAAEKWGAFNILIPSKPNGQLEVIARAHSDVWGPKIGATCSFDYSPAASGQVAYTTFSRRPGDGHYFMFGNIEPFVAMYVTQQPDFALDDLYWACTLAVDPAVIVCNKKAPFKTLEEALNAKKKLKVAVAHWASTDTLSALLTSQASGVEFNIVPYGGSNGARLALVQEEVDLYYTKLANSMEIASYIRMLAIIQNQNEFGQITADCPTLTSVLKTSIPESQSLRNWVFTRRFVDQQPERCKQLLSLFEETYQSKEFHEKLKTARVPLELFNKFRGPDWTASRLEATLAFTESYKDVFAKK